MNECHFGSSHLCSNTTLLARVVRSFLEGDFVRWHFFCAPVSRVIMVRKGWSVMEVPSDGWVKVCCGLAALLRCSGLQHRRVPQRWSRTISPVVVGDGGRYPSRAVQRPRTVRSFQAALKVLGPEEKAVREGLKASLQRAIAEAQKPRSFSADCKEFVERAQKRLVKLEAERDAENALLEEGRARLARLEAQAAARVVAPPLPAPTAVSDLEAEVSRLTAELAATRAAVVDPDCQDPDPKRPCRREEFIPNFDEEMQELMEDRHKDLQEAMVAGRLSEVARVSHLLTTAAQEWQQLIRQQSLMPSAVATSVR